MKTAEIKVLMENIAPVLKDFVGQTFAPISTRLDAIEKRFGELPVPRDGKDADTDATANIVFLRLKPELDEVRSNLEAIAPKFTEVSKLIETELPGHVERAIAAIPKAKDGVGVAGAIIDREGNLVLTTTDGAQKELGKVVGKDGINAEAIVVETAPDDVALTISKAIRLMAETPEIVSREAENGNGTVNIHLPEMKTGETVFNVSVPEQKAPVVNVAVPNQEAPVVTVEPPIVNVAAPVVNYIAPKSRRVTQVKHDKSGRIIQTISEEQ